MKSNLNVSINLPLTFTTYFLFILDIPLSSFLSSPAAQKVDTHCIVAYRISCHCQSRIKVIHARVLLRQNYRRLGIEYQIGRPPPAN